MYFFTNPGTNPVSDPWWDEFIDRLLRFGPRRPWGTEPDTGAILEVVVLEGDARASFIEFLASAPEAVQQAHRTLRKSIAHLNQTDKPIRIVYFPEH